MSSFCKLSGRWHQQFLHSPAFSRHQKCLQYYQFKRHYRHGLKATKSAITPQGRSDELKVREFDQIGDDASTRVEVDDKAELVKHGAQIKAKIEKLEKELAVLKEGPFGRNSDFMKMIPEDQRAQVLKALEAEGMLKELDIGVADTDTIDDILDGEFDDDGSGLKDAGTTMKVTLRIPKRQKVYVKRFNEALESAIKHKDDAERNSTLWKWYLRCQQHVPSFSTVMPEDVWDILWQRLDPTHRSKQIIILAKDMLAADIPLEGSQWLAYIEALRSVGDVPSAIELWEDHKEDHGSNATTSDAFWTLGVRLYASLGRPQKAQNMIFDALDNDKVTDPIVLLDVINAWSKSQKPMLTVSQKIWTCYLKLREVKSATVSPSIYEQISSMLLKSGYVDMALAVFKDMVLDIEKSSEADSMTVYKKALELIQKRQSEAVTEADVNRINLTALLIFPKRLQNKYFFGSWIKNLIGRGELDAASTVVELMYERGVKLDARHLNGLIGARLREGSKNSQVEAENLAWSMINSRIALIQQRSLREIPKLEDQTQTNHRIEELAPSYYNITKPLPQFIQRAAPPANIETFSVLLLHYTRRSDLAAANHLTRVMTDKAQIRPNSFIMNHWLYASLRQSDLETVWKKYNELKDEIRPDLETFCALWDTAKVQYDKSRAAKAKGFPSARRLFAEMMDWVGNLPERNLKRANDEFSRDLYQVILRCFCLNSDMQGLLCAMHGLQSHFGMYPNEDSTTLTIAQASRLQRPTTYSTLRKRRISRRLLGDSVQKISEIIEGISDKHAHKLIDDGMNPDTLDPQSEVAKRLQLDILTDFIIAILEDMKKPGEDVLQDLGKVAQEMHVNVDF